MTQTIAEHTPRGERRRLQCVVPRLRKVSVPRERLLARLHAGIGNGVTVVQAPAGFGKTTLLTSFALEIDYDPHWLSLDASCGSPEVFAEQIAAALSATGDGGRLSTAAKTADLQAFVSAAVRSAAARSERPLWLAIDNVHELKDSHPATGLLPWLMECLPDGSELVLCGRELPFLPEVDERIATGGCLALGSADLAFDLHEIDTAIATVGVTNASAEAVLAETDGWPVGVMAVLSGSAGSAAGAERLTSAAFERYLAVQVWDGVPQGLKPVLLALSVPPTISKASVVHQLGLEVWTDLDRWLSERDFLSERLSGSSLRLNPLLRQFLQDEFERTDPHGYEAAFERLVRAMIADGRVQEAIEVARAPGREDLLASLLQDHAPALITEGSLTSLWRAFESLSQETFASSGLLRAIWARLLSYMGDPHEALERADDLLADPSVRGAVRIHATLARFRSLRLLGRPDELLAHVATLRAMEICDDPVVLCELAFNLGEIELSVTRDFTKAERLLGDAIRAAEVAHSGPLELLARSTLGQALAMRGDAPAAVTVLTKAAAGWRKVGRSSNLGWVLNNLGMAHLDVGDFESAAAVMTEARQEGILCGNQRNVAYATASLADAQLALGNYQAAREGYEEAIRICAEDAPDEMLAALSVSGLSAAFLGLGDVQQADFFSRRATLIAVSAGNSFEIAYCKLQQAAVESVAGNHVVAIAEANEAAQLFEKMSLLPRLCVTYYRLAMAYFRANRRHDAQEALRKLGETITQPWIVGSLVPLVKEHPMFAQWAAARNVAGRTFRDMIERQRFTQDGADEDAPAEPAGRFPTVVAKSLGALSVSVGGREVTDEAWSSIRAKEMFFLLLAHRGGLRKEEAVELLYPELAREKCNSAFHSNLYRVRRALFAESVIRRDGTYLLNPDGTFEWDVAQFEGAIGRAQSLDPGSRERATAFQEAIALYQGPFAEAFFSEWARGIRSRVEQQANESLALLAGYFASRADFESAALCMERVLRANRYNEEAAYQIARFRAQGGQATAALAFLDEYRETYESELGAALPARFGNLRAEIAAGKAG